MTNKIERRVWVWDRTNRAAAERDLPISPLLNHRYHADGLCVSGEPYGTKVRGRDSYEGDPNDFTCDSCGNAYRRLAVSEADGRMLVGITEAAKNGLDDLDAFRTSTATYGCYCVTGYEHEALKCVPAPPRGGVLDTTLVPMVFKLVDMTPEDEAAAGEASSVEPNADEYPDTQEHVVAAEASDSTPVDFENPFA